ncbi:MAG: hypothetical protein KDE58_32930, partial [Caldilineaceae bacterium]|nr:hypothetical protein [Caldilineaceae bacterium]
MDYNALTNHLRELGVNPRDVLRASLYIDYLDQARNYFHTTLAGAVPGGLGQNYAFVRNAVRSANLLSELADIL